VQCAITSTYLFSVAHLNITCPIGGQCDALPTKINPCFYNIAVWLSQLITIHVDTCVQAFKNCCQAFNVTTTVLRTFDTVWLYTLISETHSQVEAEETNPNLTVLSWNVDGLDERNLLERTRKVCHIINSLKPDAVFLQEVIPESLSIFQSICSG